MSTPAPPRTSTSVSVVMWSARSSRVGSPSARLGPVGRSTGLVSQAAARTAGKNLLKLSASCVGCRLRPTGGRRTPAEGHAGRTASGRRGSTRVTKDHVRERGNPRVRRRHRGRRPQRPGRRRLSGPGRALRAGAGAARPHRRGRRLQPAVHRDGRPSVALLLPGQPAAAEDRRRPRPGLPRPHPHHLLLHPRRTRGPAHRTAGRRRRGTHPGGLRPADRRGARTRRLAAFLRHDRSRRPARLPDPHRAPAHPGRTAPPHRRRDRLAGPVRGADRGRGGGALRGRPGPGRGAHRRPDRHLRRRPRSLPGPEPLLPLPRHRRRHRRLGRARGRHGRPHRRPRHGGPRGRRGARDRARGGPRRHRRRRRRGRLPLRRRRGRRGRPARPGRRLPAGTGRPHRRGAPRARRGRPAQGQHAAHPAAQAPRSGRRPPRSLLGHLPHRRGVPPVGRRPRPGRRR
ncbi:hypothetical protein SGPA1_21110 [Streptomyces misionensis JCM 4497]